MALTKNEVPVLVSLVGNPMWADYSTDKTAEDFIGIHYDIFAKIDDVWALQGKEMRYEPDSNGNAIIDFHSLLEWDPEKEFNWKEDPSTILTKRNTLRREYFIQANEKYGNPLATDDSENDSVKYVLPGKISTLKRGLLNDQSTTWWAQLQVNKQFLTNSTRTKTTDAWSSERLYYYVFGSGVTEIELQVKIFYTDGSDSIITREAQDSVVQHDVFEVITSFSALGIYFLDPSKTIEKYEVWLRDQTDAVISEVFTYQVDHIRRDNTSYFLFANGFKMIEGARFVGDSKTNSKIDQLNLNRNMEKGFGIQDRSVVKEHPSEVEYREVSSDWLSIEEINWLREIILSKEVYEIVKGETVPVVIVSQSISTNEDNSNLRSISIRYRYAHADSVPAVLPEVVDSMSAFQNTEINIGGLNNGASGRQFATLIYDDNDGSFTLETQDTDFPLAYAVNVLQYSYLPLLACYWSLSNVLDFCDLEMLLMEYSLTVQVSPETVPIVWNESSGFGILVSNNISNVEFCVRGADGGANNTHQGYLKLYTPTRRCLEYIYEQAL